MKRATLTIAAVLAAWTLTAATVRTATETFVTNRIAIALQSATDYTDSAIAFEAGAATNYADSVAQAATNYTDSTAATLRDAIAGKADATNIYTKAEMDVAMNGLQRDIAHYGQIAENAVSSVNGKTGNAVTLDAKDIDILMVRGDVTTNIEYAVNGLDIEMGMTFDAIWRSISGKQDILPYATNAIPYAAISGKPTLAAVATSGSYNDLSNKPTIPTVPTNVSAFNNDAGYLTSYTETDPTVSAWAKAASKPTYAYSEITGKPTFATVATSGSYNDLTDKPTIPSPTAPVASATLAWQSNGSAIVVSVGAAGTLSATLTGWIEGQTQTALITIAAGASVSSEVKLVGYGTWPTGGQFLASATRVGNFVYVTPIVLVN